MRIYLLLAMAIAASFLGSNCGGEGIGDPCIPEDEYRNDFPGFSVGEVNVESRSFQCATRVCLVNHFQGRASCPYGQTTTGENSAISACGAVPPGIEFIAPEDCTPADRAENAPTTCNENVLADVCPDLKKNGDDLTNTACDPECQPGGLLNMASCRVPDRDGSELGDRITVGVQEQFADRVAADAVYCSCRCDGPDAKARYCDCPSGFKCEELVDDLGLGKGQLAGSYCVENGTEFLETNLPQEPCDSALSNCGSAYNKVINGQSIGVNPGSSCEAPGTQCDKDTLCCDQSDEFNVVAVACPDSGVCADLSPPPAAPAPAPTP
jgi:hypothetical protein